MRRPQPRGPLSAAVLSIVSGPVRETGELTRTARTVVARAGDVLTHEDTQLSLLLLQELHYRGLDGADPDWEWAADPIGARTVLERAVESALRRLTAPTVRTALDRLGPAAPARSDARPDTGSEARTDARKDTGPNAWTDSRPDSRPDAEQVARMLFAMVAEDDGPSLSRYLSRKATREEFGEFLVHRSIYHLKEADPHTWAIPRLAGRPKAALVEIQADEYGGGRPERMHSALFARTMRALGLDDGYGVHLDLVPATTLATVTAVSMFGLHRRLRGAVAGHLAAFEMTSSAPNRLYGNGLRRLGFDADATWFFDEHVEADAVHEQIAGRDLAGALVEDEPALLGDVCFGAAAALALDARAGGHLLDAWADGRSSLRDVAPDRRPSVDLRGPAPEAEPYRRRDEVA
jgi:Iron-containing redox enzyme